MQIGIHDIPRRGLVIRESITPEIILFSADDGVIEEVALDLRLDKSGQQVRIGGSAEGRFTCDCHRCTEAFTLSVTATIETIFQPRPAGRPAVQIELDEETLGLTYFDGETLDLAPLLRDALILAMPMVHLCKPDCAGLCARCGEAKDGACDCPPTEVAPGNPFAEFLRERRESG